MMKKLITAIAMAGAGAGAGWVAGRSAFAWFMQFAITVCALPFGKRSRYCCPYLMTRSACSAPCFE